MLTADTNLFVYAVDPDSPHYRAAFQFFTELSRFDDEFVLCELVLLEVYMQLRNGAILKKPYSAREAASYCGELRNNDAWRVIDYDSEVSPHLWNWASETKAGFRQIIDARLALTLRHHGVTQFATVNTKHFTSFGFARVWNPLSA